MKTRKKHVILTITTIFLAILAIAGLFTQKNSKSASAAFVKTEETLFMPTSYEQYLPLTRPTDVAFNDSYIAVADGVNLFLYDRAKTSYTQYEHDSQITKVQFTSDGKLLFSSQDTFLYAYGFLTNTANKTTGDVACSTFLVEGNVLYTATVSGTTRTFYRYAMTTNGFEGRQKIAEVEGISQSPHLTLAGNTLYCLMGDQLYQFPVTAQNLSNPAATRFYDNDGELVKLSSIYAYQDNLYFTINGFSSKNGLYRTPLSSVGKSERILVDEEQSELKGFQSLTSFSNTLYAIKGASIREISLAEGGAQYTGYVIASNADTFNRTSGADDTVRGGDLLAIADRGNLRVLIYNFKSKQYSQIPLKTAPYCLATDGELIAVGADKSLQLYRYGEEIELIHSITISQANSITGITLVYGSCYYITDRGYGALLSTGEHTEIPSKLIPSSITSDLWGNIYVSDTNGNVTKYTEQSFLDSTQKGEKIKDLNVSDCIIRADYNGNIYHVQNHTLYKNGVLLKDVKAFRELVYKGKSSPFRSFALGFEDNTVYFQYGSYMVKGNFDIPSLSKLDASGVESVFTAPQNQDAIRSVKFVDVNEQATQISVNLEDLKKSAVFPYGGHTRSQGGRGVILYEKTIDGVDYCLVALYRDYSYEVGLFRSNDCVPVSHSPTLKEGATKYISNDVDFSYAPCETQALTMDKLPRGAKVSLHGILSSGDTFEYALISCSLHDTLTYGYVPTAYLMDFSPTHHSSNEYTLRYLEEGANLTFRNIDPLKTNDVILVSDSIQVKVFDTKNGYFLASFEKDGEIYQAQITSEHLITGTSQTLRTSLIIILCVVAVGLITAYILYLMFKKKQEAHKFDNYKE